jgi:hypothetical protein
VANIKRSKLLLVKFKTFFFIIIITIDQRQSIGEGIHSDGKAKIKDAIKDWASKNDVKVSKKDDATLTLKKK